MSYSVAYAYNNNNKNYKFTEKELEKIIENPENGTHNSIKELLDESFFSFFTSTASACYSSLYNYLRSKDVVKQKKVTVILYLSKLINNCGARYDKKSFDFLMEAINFFDFEGKIQHVSNKEKALIVISNSNMHSIKFITMFLRYCHEGGYKTVPKEIMPIRDLIIEELGEKEIDYHLLFTVLASYYDMGGTGHGCYVSGSCVLKYNDLINIFLDKNNHYSFNTNSAFGGYAFANENIKGLLQNPETISIQQDINKNIALNRKNIDPVNIYKELKKRGYGKK